MIKIPFLIIIALTSINLYSQDSLKLIGTVYGEKPGDGFYCVKALGDVNGDGYDDFMVGGTDNYLKLYLGGAVFDTSRYIRFSGSKYHIIGGLGSRLGDINGDGYDDFAIGALQFDGFFKQQLVNIFLGKKNIDTLPDIILKGEYGLDSFGGGCTARDFNGDGYTDFLIEASATFTTGIGGVRLYLGGKTIDPDKFILFQDNIPGDFYGKSIACLGDINDDGYDDFAVGAFDRRTLIDSNYYSGVVYIYFGGADIDTIPDIIINQIKDTVFGYDIKSLGNIRNKKEKVFVITSSNNMYLFYDEHEFIKITNSSLNCKSDFTICNVGDLNNDGYSDFVFGNSGYRNTDSTGNGRVWYCFGNDNFKIDFSKVLFRCENYNSFGRFLDGNTDINGDGKKELLVGALRGNNELSRVYVYSVSGNINSINNAHKNVTTDFRLFQNYPNPFNPRTKIKYSIPNDGNSSRSFIKLKIFDILGREVKTLINEQKETGTYEIDFDGSNLPSGIYFCKLQYGNYSTIKKMILLK